MNSKEEKMGGMMVIAAILSAVTASVIYGLPYFFNGSNCLFFGVLNGALLMSACYVYFDYEEEFDQLTKKIEREMIITAVILTALFAGYFAEYDYRPHRSWVDTTPLFSIIKTGYWQSAQNFKVDNLLAAFFWGAMAAISICSIRLSTFTLMNQKAAKELRAGAQQQFKNNDADEFAADFDAQDDEFSYDETNFKDNKSSSNKSQFRSDGRNPEDQKFWNVVDDPEATENERATALKMIMRREATRKGEIGREVTTTQ